MSLLRKFVKLLPTLGFAFVLALAVWVNAVTARDPNTEKIYPRAVPVEIIGQDPNVVLVGDTPHQVTVMINAPQSVWNRLSYEDGLITASVDLTGLGPGVHTVPVKVVSQVRAVDVTSVTPPELTLTLEPLATRSMPIQLVRSGEPAIGYQAENPVLSQNTVTIAGAKSQVARIQEVRATLILGDAHETIKTSLPLQALDADEKVVDGVTINPDEVEVTQEITQRGGYRNVVVNVVITGQIAPGYRLTNISVFPPAVTVFSSNPQRVNDLPGYIETQPVDLEGATDDLDVHVPLNLPTGISVVGDQNVLVRVGIAAIDSSMTVSNLSVEVIGLGPGLTAQISPEVVSVILSGPLPVLNKLSPAEIIIQVDLTGMGIGTYQVAPKAQVSEGQVRIGSILPETLEVVIQPAPTPTPGRSP